MGKKPPRIALDSQSLTYAIAAFHSIEGPPPDPCAVEKLALFRLYLHLPTTFSISPTVEAEFRRITDEAWRFTHQSWCDTLFLTLVPSPAAPLVLARAQELSAFHPGKKNFSDCKVLAECELAGIDTLLSYDKRFLDRLGPVAKHVRVVRPTEFWESLSIAKGSRPNKVPHPTNPLSHKDWWRW